MGALGGREFWCELQEQPDRQADHVGDVAVDPIDQRRAQALHGVAAGAASPLPARQVTIDQLGAELVEGDATGLDPRPDGRLAVDPVRTDQREGTQDLVGAARERLEAPARLALNAGCPTTRPSTTTSVSPAITRVPSRRRAATARPLASALASTTSRGSPSLVSSTLDGIAVKVSPIDLSRDSRWGDFDARMIRLGAVTPGDYDGDRGGSALREPDPDLALGGLRRVGAVHEIEGDLGAELAPDRAGVRLRRIGGADHLARRLDCVRPLEHHRDQLTASDELDELTEERLVGVLLVVDVGDVLIGPHQLEGDEAEPLALEAGDDLASETALECVGFDEDQGAFVGHGRGTVPESGGIALCRDRNRQ